MDLQNKRILIITSVYPLSLDLPYAGFMHYRNLHLKRKTGVRISVFAPSFKGSKSHVLDGVEVYRFRYFLKMFEDLTHTAAPRKLNNYLYILISAFYILLGACQFLWVCHREKPDAIWVHWPFPHALMAWPAHKLYGIPMVMTFYGAELLLARRFFFVNPVLRWLTPLAEQITCNSEYTRKLTQDIVDSVVRVIPDGVAFSSALAPEEALNLPVSAPENHTRLLCIASLVERKGVRYLLEALPQVLESCPVKLTIVGSGPLEDDLKRRTANLGLVRAVDFVGNLSEADLVEEYCKCDMVVTPSVVDSKGDTEGLGMIPIEAMFFGRPAIACAVGGLVDVVHPGINGILVPEKDPSALAEAILKLCRDPDEAKRLGQRGREYYWQSPFTWPAIVAEYQDVFSNATRGNSDPIVSSSIET